MTDIGRGRIWVVSFGPPVGREQGDTRPALVISSDRFNEIRSAGLAFVIPLTATDRGFYTHVGIEPPEGGVKTRSFIMCEQAKNVSTRRFVEPWGYVSSSTLARVEEVLGFLLDLD
jgi:mRNA interferase MazF